MHQIENKFINAFPSARFIYFSEVYQPRSAETQGSKIESKSREPLSQEREAELNDAARVNREAETAHRTQEAQEFKDAQPTLEQELEAAYDRMEVRNAQLDASTTGEWYQENTGVKLSAAKQTWWGMVGANSLQSIQHLGSAIAHPIRTAKAMGELITSPVQSFKKVKEAYHDEWITSNTPGKIGVVWRGALDLVLGVKGVTTAVKTAKLGGLAARAGKLGKTAQRGAEAIGRGLEKTGEVVGRVTTPIAETVGKVIPEGVKSATGTVTQKAGEQFRFRPIDNPLDQATASLREQIAKQGRKTEVVSATSDVARKSSNEEVIGVLEAELAQFPDLKLLLRKYIEDTQHKLGIVDFLKNPKTRETVLQELRSISLEKTLTPDEFRRIIDKTFNPEIPIFRSNDREFSYSVIDGKEVPRSQLLRENLLAQNETLYSIGEVPTPRQRIFLEKHVDHINGSTLPKLKGILKDVSGSFDRSGGFPVVRTRAKTYDGILDKISRMRKGNDGKPPRPDYNLADMPDAVGGRIVVRTYLGSPKK